MAIEDHRLTDDDIRAIRQWRDIPERDRECISQIPRRTAYAIGLATGIGLVIGFIVAFIKFLFSNDFTHIHRFLDH